MAESSVEIREIADLYAEAILNAARDAGQEQEVASQFGDLIVLLNREPEFEKFLVTESVDAETRRSLLERVFRGRMNDLLVNGLQILNRRGRLGLIRTVGRCAQLRMERRRDAQEVFVQTAMPLWHEMRTAIRAVVGMWLGKTVVLVEEVHPEIIGGIVLDIGDTRVDGSVRGRVGTLRKRLHDRMLEELNHSERYMADRKAL